MRVVLSLLVAVLLAASVRAQAPDVEGCVDAWDVHELIRVERDKSLLYAESPDGAMDVVLDQARSRIELRHGARVLASAAIRHISWSAEVIWAPDSKAFAVQWSDGGYGGIYHARVFRIDAGKMVEFASAKKAEALFAKAHSCEAEPNNTYVLGWVAGSRQLMLGEQVYNSSVCGHQMAFYRGYLVDAGTGTVLKTYPASEVKQAASCPE